MKLIWRLAVAGCLLAPALGCAGGNDDGAVKDPQGTTTESLPNTDDPEVTTTLNKSPFCVAIRALEGLGTEATPDDPSPARVLEQNTELAQLIEDAANNSPADAPSDVVDMLSDYRAFTQAVAQAAGDVAAALAALDQATPGFMDRLNDHREAFEFFATRCGTAPPR